jgi:hypothetical protein
MGVPLKSDSDVFRSGSVTNLVTGESIQETDGDTRFRIVHLGEESETGESQIRIASIARSGGWELRQL